MENKTNFNCRLCDNETEYFFKKKILKKFYVNYFICSNCNSLQTEKPYWLKEAYSSSNLCDEDLGAAYRNLRNHEKVFVLSKILNVKKGLDWGSGDGLLCRLLRDNEINFFSSDKYSNQKYSSRFVISDFNNLDLITAFEVFEHLSDPKNEINFLFQKKPNLIFISTLFYNNNDENWHYLHSESGMHTFFYSKKSIELIAKKYNYDFYIFDNQYALFFKKHSVTKFELKILKILFNKFITKIVRIYLTLIPSKGIEKDKKYIV